MKTTTWVNGSLANQPDDVKALLTDWVQIIEVSFPNPRVNALKLVTPELTLYFRGVSPKFKKQYAAMGYALAELLKGIEVSSQMPIPELFLSVDGDYPALELGEGQVPFKCMTSGWYKAIPDEVFIDFLSNMPDSLEEEEESTSPPVAGKSSRRAKKND